MGSLEDWPNLGISRYVSYLGVNCTHDLVNSNVKWTIRLCVCFGFVFSHNACLLSCSWDSWTQLNNQNLKFLFMSIMQLEVVSLCILLDMYFTKLEISMQQQSYLRGCLKDVLLNHFLCLLKQCCWTFVSQRQYWARTSLPHILLSMTLLPHFQKKNITQLTQKHCLEREFPN